MGSEGGETGPNENLRCGLSDRLSGEGIFRDGKTPGEAGSLDYWPVA